MRNTKTIMQKLIDKIEQRHKQKEQEQEQERQEKSGAIRLLKDIFNDERKRVEW